MTTLNRCHRALCAVLLLGALCAAPSLALAEPTSHLVATPDGVTVAVHESGNPAGRPIVFVHGLLGSHLDWEPQRTSPALQRYRIITYDLRGHGLSGKPTDPDAYRQGRRWADELAAVLDATHAQAPILVGWSLGAAVISNYLAAFGDRAIAGAVYVDGVIELSPDQIIAHPDVYRDLNSPDLATHLDAERRFLGLCFATPPAAPVLEQLLANAAMASWDMQRVVSTMTVAAADGLGKARVPVLLLYGARDALISAKAAIARATTLQPRIQTKLYAKSGHAPFLEEPERFNRDLAAFVDAAQPR